LAVLVLGTLASVVGSRVVFLIAPIFLVLALVLLIRLGLRATQQEYASTRVVLDSLFSREGPRQDEPAVAPPADEGNA
ncbi:MAG: hypothetical protein QM692_16305, partial [Thermomicrobiales bacterium]